MERKRKQRYHLVHCTKKGNFKVAAKHSYGSLQVKLNPKEKEKLKEKHILMESVFKEDCRENEKPGWKKANNLTDSKLFKIADKGLLSTKKRRCKKEVETKK